MTDYSIWVIEFARASSPLGLLLHGQSGDREIPYCFTVMRSEDHTILVDSGYRHAGRGRELAEIDGITLWRDPAELVSRAGIRPEDVDAILVTHAHFDHLGNVAAFPDATVYIQRREVSKWAWAVSLPRAMDWLKQGVSIDDLAALLRLAGDGRLRLVDGHCEDVFPGVSQENCLMALDRMKQVAGGETSRILPGHEQLLWDRHPSRQFGDELHVAEICLRPGEVSRLGRDGAGEVR